MDLNYQVFTLLRKKPQTSSASCLLNERNISVVCCGDEQEPQWWKWGACEWTEANSIWVKPAAFLKLSAHSGVTRRSAFSSFFLFFFCFQSRVSPLIWLQPRVSRRVHGCVVFTDHPIILGATVNTDVTPSGNFGDVTVVVRSSCQQQLLSL